MFNFTEKEKQTLKEFAALQFPGSADNYGNKWPLHLVEKQVGDWIPTDFDDVEANMDTESFLFEYQYGPDYYSADSVYALVLAVKGITDKEVGKYNSELDWNEPHIIPFEDAIDKMEIPGCSFGVTDLSDYFTVYGIRPERVRVFKRPDTWRISNISFTHRGAVRLSEECSYPQDKSVRIYTASESEGSFPVLMQMMYRLGDVLLHEECRDLDWEENNRLGPSEAIAHYYDEPDQEFLVANYNLKVPAGLLGNDEEISGTLKVLASGQMEGIDGKEYPLASLRAILEAPNYVKRTVYPFESDYVGKSLGNRDGVFRLFNYIRFA